MFLEITSSVIHVHVMNIVNTTYLPKAESLLGILLQGRQQPIATSLRLLGLTRAACTFYKRLEKLVANWYFVRSG